MLRPKPEAVLLVSILALVTLCSGAAMQTETLPPTEPLNAKLSLMALFAPWNKANAQGPILGEDEMRIAAPAWLSPRARLAPPMAKPMRQVLFRFTSPLRFDLDQEDPLPWAGTARLIPRPHQGSSILLARPPRLGQPLTTKEKLELALRKTYGPGSLAIAALGAGFSQAVDSSLEDGYGQGVDGFARRWGARIAFKGARELVGTFAVASLLGQDPRYYPSRRKGRWRRVAYALSRVFVARSDEGEVQVNISNLAGIGGAASLANTWHRRQDRGGRETAARFGITLALDAGVRLLKEFVTHRNAHRK